MKLALFALLAVLYFNFRLFLEHKGTKAERIICFFIIITGLVEAVWGLRQLYGFVSSQHSLFKVTSSFFNPEPYAGYLAVVFPLVLYSQHNIFCHVTKIRNSSYGLHLCFFLMLSRSLILNTCLRKSNE